MRITGKYYFFPHKMLLPPIPNVPWLSASFIYDHNIFRLTIVELFLFFSG